MDLNKMIRTLKEHPDYTKMGMIASHLGVVRETSLNGRKVKGMEVSFDYEAIENILSEIREMDGIVHVIVETSEGWLKVGEEVMAVAVGGDIRDHVFPALMKAVNRIKAEATTKKESI